MNVPVIASVLGLSIALGSTQVGHDRAPLPTPSPTQASIQSSASSPTSSPATSAAGVASPSTPRATDASSTGRALGAELLHAIRHASAGHRIDLPLADGGSSTVTLEPVSIWADGARIEVVSSAGARRLAPPPRVALWRGVDSAGSRSAFLAVTKDSLSGWVLRDGRMQLISSGPRGAGLPAVAFDPSTLPINPLDPSTVVCGAELLPGYETKTWDPTAAEGGIAGLACRMATVAIETDHELLGLFGGDVDAASAYCASIIAASSEIFSQQTGVQFEVNFLRLWETPEDPWTMGNTYDQLFQWRDWWFANMGAQPRDVAHFLSGRGLGGGIAWLPGTCTFEYGYGLSANLSGSYPYPLVDYSGSNWDVMVVTHEMGHNFGAPHTHNMAPPIDGCGNGDCSQAFGGTIMSYCHTCPGGLGNVQLAFAPGTVQTILDHLATSGADCAESADVAAAVADLAATLAGSALVVDVLANDAAASCVEPALGSFDPLSAGGAAISLCAGCGLDGRDALLYAPAPSFSGVDAFHYSLAGSPGTVAVTVEVQTLLASVAPSIPRAGVVASYYALPELDALPDFSQLGSFASEVVPSIDLPSTGGAFGGSGLSELVGAVYEGFVVAPVDGAYEFFTESDDGSRLLIGDQVVVDNDGLHGMVERGGSIALAAGPHPLRVEFFERYGGAGLIVRFSGPSLPKQVVPPSLWLHEGSADLNGDGVVDGADLGILLAAWGSGDALADLNGDGAVNGADLGVLLAGWDA